ncbi:hypothetical protein MJO29_012177 [Puccinia striiformis f. sp. tritici]|nr:hypothetical protein MJO29_012177 [Puccinia striiformis f. sp. tritici]
MCLVSLARDDTSIAFSARYRYVGSARIARRYGPYTDTRLVSVAPLLPMLEAECHCWPNVAQREEPTGGSTNLQPFAQPSMMVGTRRGQRWDAEDQILKDLLASYNQDSLQVMKYLDKKKSVPDKNGTKTIAQVNTALNLNEWDCTSHQSVSSDHPTLRGSKISTEQPHHSVFQVTIGQQDQRVRSSIHKCLRPIGGNLVESSHM